MSEYYRPQSMSEAVAILADTPDATIIAGGTDLVIDRRLGRADPQAPLVDVTRLDELRGLRWDGDELTIGSAATIRQVECDPTVIARAPALAEAARVLGSVQIRNMATLGGNLCNASPAAEMAPTLMAHDAVATVHGPDGTRRQPVAALASGPRTTSLKAGEISDERAPEGPSPQRLVLCAPDGPLGDGPRRSRGRRLGPDRRRRR